MALRLCLLAGLRPGFSAPISSFVSFNDYAPGLGTGSNVTSFGLSHTNGLLKEVTTGNPTGVSVTITNLGAAGDSYQGRPDYGSPASVIFEGIVDFGGRPLPGIDVAGTNVYVIQFSGLDPSAEYNFEGTAVRGNINFKDRWSLFELQDAVSFVSHRTPGAYTAGEIPGLAGNQVVLNSGFNQAGDLAWWEHIRPSAMGTFSVLSRQYTGKVPNGITTGSAGYAMTGFRLEQAPVYTGRTELPPRQPNLTEEGTHGIKTVFLVLMENQDWASVISNKYCPYINSTLLPASSYARQYYSPPSLHPSEANYLWLMAGTNFGIRDDQLPSVNHQSSTNTLFQLLDRRGISWKCYAEEVTGTNVPAVNTGQFVARHVPFVFFDSVRTNLAYSTNHIRPFEELASDLANESVPRFCFLAPNLTNDMHNLSPGSPSAMKQGDDWLARVFPNIFSSSAYTNDGAVFLTWDEGANDTDGPIGMIVLSPRAKGGGYHNDVFYTHGSTLRTLQDIFEVKPYLGDAAYAAGLGDLFQNLRLLSVERRDDGVAITLAGAVPGATYSLQVSSDLGSGRWAAQQAQLAPDRTMLFVVREGLLGPTQFFRVAQER